MAAAVPFIASIVVGAVVSKTATKVLDKIGLSSKDASFWGSVAGIAAGAYTYGSVNTAMNPKVPPTTAPEVSSSAVATPDVAQQTVAGTPINPDGVSLASNGGPTVGNYSPLGSDPSIVQTPSTMTTTNIPTTPPEKSWYEKMWNDKTAVIGAGAVSGMAQGYAVAGAADDQRKEDRRIRDKYNKSWSNSSQIEFPTIQYPNVQTGNPGLLKQ